MDKLKNPSEALTPRDSNSPIATGYQTNNAGDSTMHSVTSSDNDFNYNHPVLTQTKDQRRKLPSDVRIFTDAEWGSNHEFLTKQFTVTDLENKPQVTVVLWSEKYPLPTNLPVLDHELLVIPTDISQGLTDVFVLPKEIELWMFYSPRDIEACHGFDKWREVLLSDARPVSKMRNINGTYKIGDTTFTLRDTSGMFNVSLEKSFESVGIDISESKKLAEGRDKSHMEEWIKEDPNTFLQYAIGDTVNLAKAVTLRIDQVNTINQNAFPHLDFPKYDIKTMKYSSGSLVSDSFMTWFSLEHPELFKAALMLSDSNNDKGWILLKRHITVLEDNPEVDLLKMSRKLSGNGGLNGIASGSIRAYGFRDMSGTALINTIVQGGRCVNEYPRHNIYEQRIKNVIDIDLESCYGTALNKFDFPIGLPTVWERGRDDEPTTLGQFLKEHETELVPGLWQIYVSGYLKDMIQDLIYSKYELTTDKIRKTLISENFDHETETGWNREVEQAHMGGQFLLTLKQIEHGIITHEVLKVLKAVASNKEWKELMNLSVDTASYYPKSLEVTHEQFITIMNNENLRGKKGSYKGKLIDSRSRRWTRFPLEQFIWKYIEYRKSIKTSHPLLQNAVKLFINTLYGDLAAPYFPIGNTILANNITAKARTGVWMLSKALCTVQSITDGGMFDYKKVAHLKKSGGKIYLPSLSVLADRESFQKHRSITIKPLTDKDVIEQFKTDFGSAGKWLDTTCTEHINKFWNHYGLESLFKIECKYANIGEEAIYHGSSDYLIYNTIGVGKKQFQPGNYTLKCRGAKQSEHPKQLWLWHILDPEKYPVPNPEFQYSEILGLNDFLKTPSKYEGVLPGWNIEKVSRHMPFTNGEKFNTYDEWKKVDNAKSKAKIRAWKEEPDYFGLAAEAMGIKSNTNHSKYTAGRAVRNQLTSKTVKLMEKARAIIATA